MAKFRKVYLVTESNNVFTSGNYISTTIFREKQSAENVCDGMQRKAMEDAEKFYNTGKPIPKYKVHAFYILHEGFFE